MRVWLNRRNESDDRKEMRVWLNSELFGNSI